MATEKEKEEAQLRSQIDDLREKQAHMAEQIDEILKKVPIPRGDLTAYLDDPNNYPPGQFAEMREKQELKKKNLLAQFGLEPKKSTKPKKHAPRKKWLKLD